MSDSKRELTTLIVTGGAGFIGSNFIHRTLSLMPEVSIVNIDALTYAGNPRNLLMDDGRSLAEAFPGRYLAVQGDINDEEVLDKALNLAGINPQEQPQEPTVRAQTHALVHFAAESHVDNSLRNPEAFVHTNVTGTVKLLERAVRHGLHFHNVSTDEVFGDLPLDSDVRFTEATPYNPSSPYSASKAAGDQFVRAFARSFGLSATISNCSNNYGPRQHPEKFIPRQITGLIRGQQPQVYGDGLNVRDWIHVDDHNDAVWQILTYGAVGEMYLIGANGERNNTQVVQDLLGIWGEDPESYIHIADRPGHDRRYAIDPASILELGWKPHHTDFIAGLEATVDWYQDHPEYWDEAREQSEKAYAAVQEQTRYVATSPENSTRGA